MKKIILLFCFLTAGIMAQDDTSYIYRIILHDGMEFEAVSYLEKDSIINLKTSSGLNYDVPMRNVEKIEKEFGHFEQGKFYIEDFNRTRLFLTPTSVVKRSGKVVFNIVEVFFPTLSVGVADIFDVGAGMTIFPIASEQAYYLSLKARVLNTKYLQAGAGLFHISLFEEGVTLAHVTTTLLSDKGLFNFGVGFGLNQNSNSTYALLIGGEIRLSSSFKLISDNQIYIYESDANFLLSAGFRIFGRSLAADLGLYTTPIAFEEEEGFPFFPYVGFSFTF